MQQLRQYGFFLLLPILVGLVFFTTQFKTDISSFFIAGKNAQEVLLANEIQSGVLSKRYILAIGSDTQAPSSGLINTLNREFKNIQGVNDVWKAEEKRGALEAIQSLYAKQGANLYSRNPEVDLPKLLTAEALTSRAKGLKAALLSPQGELIEKIASLDPLLLVLNGLAEKPDRFLKPAGNSNSTYQNLILETKMSGMDVPSQIKIQEQIRTIFASQKNKFSEPVNLEMTGVGIFAVATQSRMENEITFISILSSVALCGLFFWIFKSMRVLFWVASLLVTVICIAIMATNLVFGFVHVMTLGIGTTLIGICIDYPIHALVHGQATPIEQRSKVIAKIWPSMLLGGATTLIGYVALGASGYPGFQQVAVYAGAGILVALLLTRYVLPSLMTIEMSPFSGAKFVEWWLSFCQKFRPQLFSGVVVLAILSLLPLSSLTWMQDLQELTPEMNELKANDAKIRARMVSLEPGRFILISGNTLEQALQQAERVYPRLDKLKASGDLSDYFGLYPWLLSQQQQQKNAQSLKTALTAEKKQLWQKILTEQGLSVKYLGNLDYAEEKPLSLEQIKATPLGRLLDNQIINNGKQHLVIIWLAEHKAESLQAAFANDENVQYVSQRDMLNEMAVTYQNKAETMLLAGMLAILLLLIVQYRNLRKVLETLAPAFLSAVIILSLCAVFGVAISFLHLVGFLLIVSICVDYGIFYQENRAGHLSLTYQAMAASMLTSSLAFGCLIIAETTVLKILAQVVASGVLLGFLLCPIIIGKPKSCSN